MKCLNLKQRLKSLRTGRPVEGHGGTVTAAAILHIDIVGSTRLVQRDMVLAHRQIRTLYMQLSRICALHHGTARELRGDAAIVHFPTAGQALAAALAVRAALRVVNGTRLGSITPGIRMGISYGDVLVDEQMITGEAVILAQRLEQLADGGEILVDQTIRDGLGPDDTKYSFDDLGALPLKGFCDTRRVYRIGRRQTVAAGELQRSFDVLATTW